MEGSDSTLLASEGSPAEGPLAETIFRSLLTQIYDGRLAAGALLNEAALAEEYRVSRGPVREAIRRLQGFRSPRCACPRHLSDGIRSDYAPGNRAIK